MNEKPNSLSIKHYSIKKPYILIRSFLINEWFKMGEVLAQVKPMEIWFNFDTNEFAVYYRIDVAGESYQIEKHYKKDSLKDESTDIQEKINAYLDRITEHILETMGDIPIKWQRFDILITKLF